VVYSSVRGTESKIRRLGLESNEPPRVLFESESGAWPAAISPDRRWLVFDQGEVNTEGSGIWMLPLDGSGEPKVIISTPAGAWNAALSRDGRWLAYQSDETGRDEISVVAFPEPGRPIPISSSGGNRPVWSPIEDELFYQEGNRIMAVKMSAGGSGDVEFGEPEHLFQFEGVAPPTPDRKWDISPDGQQFAATEMLDRTGTRTELHVVFNWFEELERLVPTGDGN
jgi:serine/threonine-protein kinase